VRRRLINLVTAMSLLLCVAACVLWVRSHWLSDRVGWADVRSQTMGHPVGWYYSLNAYRGGLYLLWVEAPLSGGGVSVHSTRIDMPHIFDVDPGSGGIGFRYNPRRSPALHVVGFAGVPLWFVALLAAAAPAARFCRGRHTRSRRAAGLCPGCGYDLRATPGRCPECGEVTP
jgi:hypothetical protein